MKKEYDLSKLQEVPNPFRTKSIGVGINLNPKVITYFKKMAIDTGVPYQRLINYYLLDCVKKKRKLKMEWSE
jgi:predicted DNA binding CopG/RHH family protein